MHRGQRPRPRPYYLQTSCLLGIPVNLKEPETMSQIKFHVAPKPPVWRRTLRDTKIGDTFERNGYPCMRVRICHTIPNDANPPNYTRDYLDPHSDAPAIINLQTCAVWQAKWDDEIKFIDIAATICERKA